MSSAQILVDLDLDDLIFEAEFFVTMIDPGRTSGPAEECYPPEGGAEIEWLKVQVRSQFGKGQTFDCNPDNFPDMVERLTELAYDEFIDKSHDNWGEDR